MSPWITVVFIYVILSESDIRSLQILEGLHKWHFPWDVSWNMWSMGKAGSGQRERLPTNSPQPKRLSKSRARRVIFETLSSASMLSTYPAHYNFQCNRVALIQKCLLSQNYREEVQFACIYLLELQSKYRPQNYSTSSQWKIYMGWPVQLWIP